MVISWFIIMACGLLGVAFLTLLERKVLSLSQIRIGPNKVFLYGIIQPLMDGLKLLVKPSFLLKHNVVMIYFFSGWVGLGFNLLLWMVLMLPSMEQSEFQFLWLVCISGLSTYVILLAGWGALSKFSLIGGVRSLAQAISYEIILTLMIFLPFLMSVSTVWKENHMFILIMGILWIVILVMETQRAPFDLAEGESELVSGFNTEYGSLLFTYFFLAEYGNILVLSLISALVWFKLSMAMLIFVLVWLYFRAAYPRVRYDMVMTFTWMVALPLVLSFWFIFIFS